MRSTSTTTSTGHPPAGRSGRTLTAQEGEAGPTCPLAMKTIAGQSAQSLWPCPWTTDGTQHGNMDAVLIALVCIPRKVAGSGELLKSPAATEDTTRCSTAPVVRRVCHPVLQVRQVPLVYHRRASRVSWPGDDHLVSRGACAIGQWESHGGHARILGQRLIVNVKDYKTGEAIGIDLSRKVSFGMAERVRQL